MPPKRKAEHEVALSCGSGLHGLENLANRVRCSLNLSNISRLVGSVARFWISASSAASLPLIEAK